MNIRYTKIAFLTILLFIDLQSANCENLHTINISNRVCNPTVEICGNSIDEDCNGADELCLGTDKDADGFVGTNDCDDSNPSIYSGTSISCNATCGDGHKQCLNTGTYSTCTCEALCEAINGGRCFYIDPIRGNNSNPGSFSARKKDLSSFSTLGTGSSRIQLTTGDRIYIFNGLIKAINPLSRDSSILTLININASEANPIVISNYPGNTPILIGSNQSTSIKIINSSFIKIIGLTFQPEGAPINIELSKNLDFKNISIQTTANSKLANITISNSNNIKLTGFSISKSFLNPTSFDNILSINSSKIIFSQSFID